MNWFDLVAVIVLIAAILAGIRTGALPQVGGITGAIGGLLLVLALTPTLLDLTRDFEPIPRAIAVLGAVLAGVVIGEALGSAVGRLLARQLGRGVLSSVDRFAGGFLGAAQAILIVWLVGGLLAAGPFPTLGRAATQSAVVRGVDQFLPPPTEVVGRIAGALDASGLPDVFVGLDPIPLPAVDTPSDPQAARIAKAATGSTARVATRACDTQVNGTAVRRRPRLSRHQRPRRRRRDDRPRQRSGRRSPTPSPSCSIRTSTSPSSTRRTSPARRCASRRRSRSGAPRARPSGTPGAGRSSCCRPRWRARTRPPATTSTTPA